MEKRLIRFRGKRLEDGKWVYGYLIQDEVGTMSSLTTRSFIAPTLPTENTYGHLWLTYMNEVDPKTVGQYAGFEDKNKWPIYDGDIVKDGEFIRVILWVPKAAAFCECSPYDEGIKVHT